MEGSSPPDPMTGLCACGILKPAKPPSAPFTGHTSVVRSVAVSPDGKLIASGSDDGTLRIWDSDTGACPLGPIAAHSRAIQSVAFSPDGSRIVTGSDDKTPEGLERRDRRSLSWTDDRTYPLGPFCCLLARWHLYRVRIRRSNSSRLGCEHRESRTEPLIGHTGVVLCVAISADGHYLASSSNDKTIRVWDVTQEFAEIAATHTLGSTVRSLSFSPTSNRLVSGFDDGTLRFWNINVRQPQADWRGDLWS